MPRARFGALFAEHVDEGDVGLFGGWRDHFRRPLTFFRGRFDGRDFELQPRYRFGERRSSPRPSARGTATAVGALTRVRYRVDIPGSQARTLFLIGLAYNAIALSLLAYFWEEARFGALFAELSDGLHGSRFVIAAFVVGFLALSVFLGWYNMRASVRETAAAFEDLLTAMAPESATPPPLPVAR